MIRASDVSKIMTKKHGLTRPHFIKQDMPREQRVVEAVLLKERWKLIQSGVPRTRIRINKGQLFVNGELHGQVENAKFHCVRRSPTQFPTQSHPTALDKACLSSMTTRVIFLFKTAQCLINPQHLWVTHVLRIHLQRMILTSTLLWLLLLLFLLVLLMHHQTQTHPNPDYIPSPYVYLMFEPNK